MTRAGTRILAAGFAVLLMGTAAAGAEARAADVQRLYTQGQYEDSRVAAIEVLRSNPLDIDTYVLLCSDLIALKRYPDAQNYALKAYGLRRDPRITELLGEAAFNLGNNDAALKLFQNYVTAVPEGSSVGSAYFYMGEIFLRLARYAHADIALSTALQFVPGNAGWWARLGWARERANDRNGALAAYRSALAIDPRQEDALLGMSRLNVVN
jgi:tetratricopeptide (TPR) repeat protein